MTQGSTTDRATVLIVNPNSGSGDHLETVRGRAATLGYTVRTSEREGHAIDLTEEAIDEGFENIVAVGGDGTVNEVLQGILAADAGDEVSLGVVPAGTGNDFADHLGIPDIDEAFSVLQHGDRRRIDIGLANGAPFLNSCIAGITAEASARTSSELKSRLGVLAYVVTTIRTLSEFHALELTADVRDGGATETVWAGPAGLVLIGNGRRFSMTGGQQANMEDGLFDVTLVEDPASISLVGDQALETPLGRPELTRFRASTLELGVETGEQATFSLDGEIREFSEVHLRTDPGAIRVGVGDTYNPTPEGRND